MLPSIFAAYVGIQSSDYLFKYDAIFEGFLRQDGIDFSCDEKYNWANGGGPSSFDEYDELDREEEDEDVDVDDDDGEAFAQGRHTGDGEGRGGAAGGSREGSQYSAGSTRRSSRYTADVDIMDTIEEERKGEG